MKKILFHCMLLLLPASVVAQDTTPVTKMIERAVQTGKADTTAAEKIFQEAITKALKAIDPYLAGKAYYELGQMYFLHKNHNRSFGAYFNARDQFNKAGAKKEVAYTLFGLGRQQYYRGNYKVAAGHLNYAMRAAKTLRLPALESEALEYLGILYHVMPGTDRQSIPHFKRSFSNKEKLHDRKGMLRMLEKLGDVYYQQKRYDSALFYLDESVALATELKLHHDAYISRLDRAGTFIRLNNMEEAEKDIHYIALKGDTADLNIAIRYFIQKGNYLTAHHQLAEGKNNYNQALAVANRIGVPDMYGMVYKQMAEAYSCLGMFKEAYEFSQQYNNQMMGYYAENVQAIKDLEYIFNTAETKNEVTFLSGENKLKEIRLQNEQQLRAVLLTGAITLLLLAAVIFYLYRKQKKKNSIIKKQADDLQTLMKEIHHRVKNNLQIISSLLDLQSVLIKDNQAAQAIREGRNRVQSMALIHQNLYSEKHIKGIAVDEYINNLAQSLFQSYNIRPGQVALTTDIEKMDLDVDTVIPIGLMLNELISNSLKYAFDNSTGGKIEVTLKKSNGALLLQVKDNGKGFPEAADPAHSTSFGMRMIKIFAQKLKADLDIYNDQGACITMHIRKYKMAG
jgi:two-component sensor histidine kinase/tetratricopeptide (TPR) repeat protein